METKSDPLAVRRRARYREPAQEGSWWAGVGAVIVPWAIGTSPLLETDMNRLVILCPGVIFGHLLRPFGSEIVIGASAFGTLVLVWISKDLSAEMGIGFLALSGVLLGLGALLGFLATHG